MYQCLGLNIESEGGCGEDWWHPECILGLPRDWYKSQDKDSKTNGVQSNGEPATESHEPSEDEEHPVSPGFPNEGEFETLVCYKCTNSSPWIRQYAHADGFMYLKHEVGKPPEGQRPQMDEDTISQSDKDIVRMEQSSMVASRKRKAEEDTTASGSSSPKKLRTISEEDEQRPAECCRKVTLPPAPSGSISLFARDEDFRSIFCRCSNCYPSLSKFPQLLEEEDIYEPPMSEDADNPEGGGSVGTGSLLDRGEAALSNIDRVRAIGKLNQGHLSKRFTS